MIQRSVWIVGGVLLGCGRDSEEPGADSDSVDTTVVEDTSSIEDTSSSTETGTSGDSADTGEPSGDPAADAVAAMTEAANDFLASLGEEQQSEVRFALDDPARSTWSNLPLGSYPREGLLTGDLTESQLALFYRLLEISLSSQGYTQALDIIALDQHQYDLGNTHMGEDLYSMSIFGEPSTTEPWSWQFDGHHLCFTFTVHTDRVTMSPSLWGADPVEVQDAGDLFGLRAMADEVDQAFVFLESLTDAQREVAILGDVDTTGLVGGPGRDDLNVPPQQLGLSVAELDDGQRELLLDLAATFVLDLEDHHAAERMAEIEAGLDDLHFAWMGPTEEGSSMYYRIFGPTVLIELDHTGGVEHIHAVYRDPANDYGEDILGAHYARFPHSHHPTD